MKKYTISEINSIIHEYQDSIQDIKDFEKKSAKNLLLLKVFPIIVMFFSLISSHYYKEISIIHGTSLFIFFSMAFISFKVSTISPFHLPSSKNFIKSFMHNKRNKVLINSLAKIAHHLDSDYESESFKLSIYNIIKNFEQNKITGTDLLFISEQYQKLEEIKQELQYQNEDSSDNKDRLNKIKYVDSIISKKHQPTFNFVEKDKNQENKEETTQFDFNTKEINS